MKDENFCMYTWVVVRNNQILGYINVSDEFRAREIAAINFGLFELEKIYLVGLVPEGKEFLRSNL